MSCSGAAPKAVDGGRRAIPVGPDDRQTVSSGANHLVDSQAAGVEEARPGSGRSGDVRGWSSWADIEAVDSEQRRAELEGEHGLLSAETGGEKQDCSLLSRSAFGGRSGVLLSERVRVRVIDRSHPSWPPRAGGRAVRPDDDGDL